MNRPKCLTQVLFECFHIAVMFSTCLLLPVINSLTAPLERARERTKSNVVATSSYANLKHSLPPPPSPPLRSGLRTVTQRVFLARDQSMRGAKQLADTRMSPSCFARTKIFTTGKTRNSHSGGDVATHLDEADPAGCTYLASSVARQPQARHV